MNLAHGSFRPGELVGADEPTGDAELAVATGAARQLESALPSDSIGPSATFADRVMAAVALEPAPRPAGFLGPLTSRPGLAGLGASLRAAWAVAAGGAGRPIAARGLALAYVLAILVAGASLTGVAAYGAAGALGFIEGDASPTPSGLPAPSPSAQPSPSATPITLDATRSPEASDEPEPSGSVQAGQTDEPEASDDHETATPGATQAPSPDASEDDGAAPSPGDDSSPEPSDTPRPSGTPKPSETPH